MKQDPRVESTWTREGIIYFKFKQGNIIFCIRGIHEGGKKLQYTIEDSESCFVKQ